MTIIKRVPTVGISARIPEEAREKARKLAREKGVTESEVYRSIIANFFSVERLQIVNEGGDKK